MNHLTEVCSENIVREFLNGSLAPNSSAAFEDHLSSCELCQRRLDEATASADDWGQLKRSLRSLEFDVRGEDGPTADDAAEEFYRSFLSPSDDPQMLGRIGNYEVAGVIGQGGMGVVFRALDRSLNRYVAIKMLAPHFASNATARQRFFREAQAAAAVVHEHVVGIHGVSEWQGIPYLVMTYIRGESLRRRLEKQGPLPLRELLRIGMQVASGLAAAHAQGLIHRDIKPGNILLEEGVDRVVLTDFGLAQAVDDVRLTRTDTLVGTPQYMSPEQTRDETLDFRSDLFSLGTVLYEAAVGRNPFQAMTTYGVIKKINDTTPPPVHERTADIPMWFGAAISKLLASRRDDRFETASEVADVLRQCLAHTQQPHLTALPRSLAIDVSDDVELVSSFSTPQKWRVLMVATALLTVVGAGVLFLPTDKSTEQVAPVEKLEMRTIGDPPSFELLPEDDGLLAQRSRLKNADPPDPNRKYSSAQEAFSVGAAYYNSRNFKASQQPFEAALKMAKDDKEMTLKLNKALLASYRLIPEFEPFQKAAEYVIENDPQDAGRSLVRRDYISFAFQRGQIDNLIQQYEKRLKKDPDDYMAVFLLSEIYSSSLWQRQSPEQAKRSVELLEQLAKLDAKRNGSDDVGEVKMSPVQSQKHAREQAKLAAQYMKSGQFKQSAELYEEIADLDPTTKAWHLKEAASAYLKLNDKVNALRLAEAADATEPEARNDLLAHFFHRNLGDTFMALDKPAKAIPHYESAIEKTTIEGYLKDTKASLVEAKAKVE